LGAAFGGVLDEPIPTQLLDAANASAADVKSASVTDLGTARAARQRAIHPKPRWSWREWTTIAASLVIGILAGRTALQPSHSNLFATAEDGIVARGDLSKALTEQAGGTAGNTQIRIGLTFQDKLGQYCRTFTTGSSAGFACRDANAWKVRALSESVAEKGTGEYRMAGTELPQAILTAVEDSMAGEALDREQEDAARARDWKK
jgi:hypothetical protein